MGQLQMGLWAEDFFGKGRDMSNADSRLVLTYYWLSLSAFQKVNW